ncbi:RtcB family protein [Methylocystis sp. MJC1]|jgi:tRNA-splicing ligase RtcB|uniref:RtcB family protein n=1 Tax=Methylocystis sp. MJC1 TaxID=2654282 RepID=UPI0013EA13F0|nr:RtcB family protein [Methylocystis sp. MJC1]KAF2989559.1 RNA-splicing ligase RtcB [Methylocystis sp. MJC1]UZX11423.1 RtcB family protein [Methylocystis sp. MJC1]
MDMSRLEQLSDTAWRVEPFGEMRAPAIIYASRALIAEMDDKVFDQVTNVAKLPGIVRASYAMPDAHWGYGFPIGGVAAFDAKSGGVVSAGGVGFDVSCGVRTHLTGLKREQIFAVREKLANALYEHVPAGLGSEGGIHLDDQAMTFMLSDGAVWAVENGYGRAEDLERIEEGGRAAAADPAAVSEFARKRQRHEMGTLGSGNHYLEVQEIAEIFDDVAATGFGLRLGECVVTIHCGSRGLGHQIGTEFLREMVVSGPALGVSPPDRELACAPILSELGQRYLGAMRGAINCALANREIIGHLTRQVFAQLFSHAELPLMFDVSHNTCKVETHEVDGEERELYLHRKGATRAFGPGDNRLPEALRLFGQPVLIGGSMGTGSYVLAGMATSEAQAFSSACHGAGRRMSRHAATRIWGGRQVVDELRARGIIVKSPSMRGVAEEAPGAYKDVRAVVDSAEAAGLARKVAYLKPLICVKG